MKHLLALVTLLIAAGLASAYDYLPEFEEVDCYPFIQTLAAQSDLAITCGRLRLPENRSASDGGGQVDLFIVRIPALNDTNNAPFINLEGGPGGASTPNAAAWLESAIHADYEIILFDQRGTGFSTPSLNCHEGDEAAGAETVKLLSACRQRLVAEGIDLNAYNSRENAADLHDLMVALDIEAANIYGTSYGTRLALTLLRDNPSRVRSVVIDAVFPPHVQGIDDQPYYGSIAFDRLFNDCAASPDCSQAYPDLRQSFYTAVETLNEAPAEIMDMQSGEFVEADGDSLIKWLFSMLYDTSVVPALPAILDAYGRGEYDFAPPQPDMAEDVHLDADASYAESIEPDEFDYSAMRMLGYETFDELLAHYASLSEAEFNALIDEVIEYQQLELLFEPLGVQTVEEAMQRLEEMDPAEADAIMITVTGEIDSDSEGMFNSVECYEEVHFNSEEAIRAHSPNLPDVLRGVMIAEALSRLRDCEIWNVEISDAIENEPVRSDVPTLIFSGAYDPITPPDWGDQAGKYLSSSWHYVFPSVGHGALDNNDCATWIALQFLAEPAQQPDAVCLQEETAPKFYISG